METFLAYLPRYSDGSPKIANATENIVGTCQSNKKWHWIKVWFTSKKPQFFVISKTEIHNTDEAFIQWLNLTSRCVRTRLDDPYTTYVRTYVYWSSSTQGDWVSEGGGVYIVDILAAWPPQFLRNLWDLLVMAYLEVLLIIDTHQKPGLFFFVCK